MASENLWEQVGNKCLSCALTLLETKTTQTEATVEVVKALVETAVLIDTLNLRWEQQSRSGAAVFQGPPFSRPEAGS